MGRQLIGRTQDEAERIYKMWHEKEPREVIRTTYPFEDYVPRIVGVADTIVYVSDKWEADGDVYDYIHYFDSHPEVYVDDDEEGDGIDPASLLGVPEVSKRATTSLPILAGVRELVFVREDGKKHRLVFRSIPMMCSTLDKQGIVILTQKIGPVYIRGGKMRVTERGIVQ